MIMGRNKLFERLKGYRNLPEGFYHLTFDSIEDGQLFHNDAEFSQGMNSVALGQLKHKLTIIVFNWMINHGHFLVKGTGTQCVDFFLYEKRRINSMLVSGGHKTLDDDYGFKLVRIESEQQLEDTIIYICRNPYKAMQDITPTGYIWGTNYLIFSNLGKIISKVPVSELQSTMLRKILMTREVIPNNYLFNKEMGFILPESYTKHEIAMKVLKSSSNYCNKLLRNIDAYIKIAEGIGETVRIDDKELDYIIWSIVRNQLRANSVAELGTDRKCQLAVMLRKKYYIEPKRICRKVGLPLATVQNLIG